MFKFKIMGFMFLTLSSMSAMSSERQSTNYVLDENCEIQGNFLERNGGGLLEGDFFITSFSSRQEPYSLAGEILTDNRKTYSSISQSYPYIFVSFPLETESRLPSVEFKFPERSMTCYLNIAE